jgi:hypothetical protein
MTDTQLYLAVGVPSLLALMNTTVMLVMFSRLDNDIRELRQRINDLTGAIYELDKRLTKVEIKLGIQS